MRIIISGNQKNLTFYSYKKNKAVAVIPFGDAALPPSEYPVPEQWNCISLNSSIDGTLFPSPPKIWQIIDTTFHDVNIPPHWPSPQPVNINGIKDCSISSISFSSGRPCFMELLLPELKIFLIDAADIDKIPYNEKQLKEACEILIIINADMKSALYLRYSVRPFYTVAFGNFKEDITTYPNLLLSGMKKNRADQLIFRTDLKKKIVLEYPKKNT